MSLLDYLKDPKLKHDYFHSIPCIEKNLVFFIMPFKKKYIDLFENDLKPLIKKEFSMDSEIATDRFTVSGFTQKIWEQICEARLIIADVTGWNANVLYELGLAHALSKKCIIIARRKFKLPSDLGHIDCIKYNFGFFKKDIDSLKKKLISAINQVLYRGKLKIHTFGNWQETRGPWIRSGEILRLSAPLISPDAYYIWNPVSYSTSIAIKFRLKFTEISRADLRIACFSKSPSETYFKSNHILLIIPWEGGDYRLDGLTNGKPLHFFQGTKTPALSIGQQYYYDIRINENDIIAIIDGKIVIKEAIQNIIQFQTSPAYWGFSSIGGNFEISELEIDTK